MVLFLHSPITYVFTVGCLSNGYVYMAWYLVKHRDNFNFIKAFC